MIAFDAGCFNGTINLSQLWNALLFIARDAEQPSVLFSCDKSKLPEMYQTDNDYATILRFAIRSALIDAVKIEGSLDEDDIDDIAGQAVDLGSVPIIVIRADQGAKADELVQKMESRWDLEAKTFELAVPVQTKEDIQALEDAAKTFHEAHHDATVIPHPIGKIAKEAMLQGQTFGAPLLYTTDGEETETLPTSTAIHKLLHPEE